MVVVLMGVAGSGKTTVGSRLAAELGWAFHDGDDFHPPANLARMRAGVALTDRDRAPWLEALHELVRDCERRNSSAVIACSALKQSYRRRLLDGTGARLVYLRAGPELIRRRLEGRVGHFFAPALLSTQFAALEPPEGAVEVDAGLDLETMIRRIRSALAM